MKTKGQKSYGGWFQRSQFIKTLQRIFRRPIADGDVLVEPAKPLLGPLARIQEHLHLHGLGQQVHARQETVGDGFVLEDDDGFVHAKDYAAAVVMIERIWLYRPGMGARP